MSIVRSLAREIRRGLSRPLSKRGRGATAAPAAYTPVSEFSGGAKGAWWDCTNLDNLWQDTAGTSPCTAAGQTVARVDDTSGNDHHLLQSTAGLRPTLRQDADGVYYLEFDGVDDYLTVASTDMEFLHDGTGGFIAFGGNLRRVSSSSQFMLATTAFVDTGVGLILYAAQTTQLGVYSPNGAAAVLSGTSGNGMWAGGVNGVMSCLNLTAGGGNDFSFRKNGAAIAGVEDGAVPSVAAASADLFIGSSTAGSVCAGMNLYGLLLVERATVSTDAEDYLAALVGDMIWTPDALTNVSKIWLNDLGDVTDAGSSLCSQWDDISGGGFFFSQTVNTNRPLIVTSGLNSRRTMRFDGVDNYMDRTSPGGRAMYQNVSAAWAFFVYKKLASDPSSTVERVLLGVPNGTSGAARFTLMAGSTAAKNKPSTWIRRLDADGLGQLTATSESGTSWRMVLFQMDYSAGDCFIAVNGAADVQNLALTSSGSTSNTASNYGLTLGAFNNGGGVLYSADVEIAEFITGTNSLPTTDEVDKLFGYAAHRWGLTADLPALHPYKTDAPLL